MATGETTYDIIFAGGGASACVTAGRLAAADPSLKILVLEAGAHTRDLDHHVQPGNYFSNLLVPRDVFSFHLGQGGKGTNGRTHIVPTGRALGGGSAVNFVMYVRPAASDYDDWENVHGNKGWGSKDLIPLLRKAETYQPDPSAPTHGFDGPLKISFAQDSHNVSDEALRVAQAYEKEYKAVDDFSNFSGDSINGWTRIPRWIDAKTGRRSDTAHYYIYNQDHNKNLEVLTRRKVARVIFEGNRAVGVEHVDDVVGRSKCVPESRISKASRLVVLSAGAFGSPAILERSGIGAANVLEKCGIKQLVDLPGVGEKYLDHNVVFVPYHASEDAETMDSLFRATPEEAEVHSKRWLEFGGGLLANNGINSGIKLRPTKEDLKSMSPEFDDRWATFFANAPDKPVMVLANLSGYFGVNPAVPRGNHLTAGYYSCYPISTGHLHVTSATDLYSHMDFKPGFLEHPADVAILRWTYKRSREITRRMKYYRGEVEICHPQYPAGSLAASKRTDGPVDIDAPPLVYTREDDEAIDEYHRQNIETTWHSIGTCPMKPREKGGVVDSRLNVYGVKNLKVADCSITPSNVSANTYSTAVAIGEKAAVIIAEELGIKGVTAGPS
ncbi:hypothetical protein NLJ89_g2088 [Agrocybe chaxingu]|uniref:pyranose dehydrogenase (acceptor) n=1 Tax=Agrocybe chaxingu TaxID=84603 RepID=A0A9W8MWT4_9AGAR|nr:hypothetical protein NLJ89_g2088 [Agrocybe chaxingu]